MNRREVMKSLAVLSAAGMLPGIHSAFAEAAKYGLKQSACLWCYGGYMKKNNISLDQFCEAVAKIGVRSLELTGASQWEVMKKYGLCCAMLSAPMGIARGFNHTKYHEELIVKTKACIDEAVSWGFKNVICMSGNCEGMGKEEGMANCVKGLKEVVPYAEKKGIELEHYITSSGLKEIIEGSKIANCFKRIYDSSYLYSTDGIAEWPAQAINYTNTVTLCRLQRASYS